MEWVECRNVETEWKLSPCRLPGALRPKARPFRDKPQRRCQQGDRRMARYQGFRVQRGPCLSAICECVCVWKSCKAWHLTALSCRHRWCRWWLWWRGRGALRIALKRESELWDRQAWAKKSRVEKKKKTQKESLSKKMEEKNGRIYRHFFRLCRTADIAATTGTKVKITPTHISQTQPPDTPSHSSKFIPN